ncbi:hypothetical protein BKA93DRAFT_737947, partial [Sparassis latifolia]
GPFADLEKCLICEQPHYDSQKQGKKKISHQEFHTIPIGPQLQALWRSHEGAGAMHHHNYRTEEILKHLREHNYKLDEYDDVYHDLAYLKAVHENRIRTDDMVLLMSIDASGKPNFYLKLYQSKASDCWIYIWVILDLAPDLCYKKKHVLPGGFISGPNKPKNVDSCLFPDTS